MTVPIHVLFSHFTEIGRREVGETMCCLVTAEKFVKCSFVAATLRSFDGGCQKFAGKRAKSAHVSV